MKATIRDLDRFSRCVFGADCFLEYFPELLTTGVELKKHEGFFYVMRNGVMVHDTAFFSEEEMEHLVIQ